jgi:hypothetical protein
MLLSLRPVSIVLNEEFFFFIIVEKISGSLARAFPEKNKMAAKNKFRRKKLKK